MFPFKDKRKDKSEMAGVVHKAKGRWVGHPHVGPLWTASYKQVISVPKDSRWCQRSLPGPAVLWQSGARHWEGTEWPDWGKQTSSKLSSYSDLRMREIRGQCTLDTPPCPGSLLECKSQSPVFPESWKPERTFYNNTTWWMHPVLGTVCNRGPVYEPWEWWMNKRGQKNRRMRTEVMPDFTGCESSQRTPGSFFS